MAVSADILRGHTDTIILNILRQGDSYGYEIAKTVFDISGGKFDVTEATIYIAFRRLEKDGFIVPYWGDGAGGARRRYYKITDAGKKAHDTAKEEWTEAAEILSNLIGGKLK